MGTANIVFGYRGSGVARDHASFSPSESEALTTSTSSASTTATAPAAVDGREIIARVYLSEAGWVWPGASPTASKTTAGIKLAANTELYLALSPGDKIAVLDDA